MPRKTNLPKNNLSTEQEAKLQTYLEANYERLNNSNMKAIRNNVSRSLEFSVSKSHTLHVLSKIREATGFKKQERVRQVEEA